MINSITNKFSFILSDNRPTIELFNLAQKDFIDHILSSFITFGVGPAGTGKTYLSIACGVHLLLSKKIKKLILSLPYFDYSKPFDLSVENWKQSLPPCFFPLMETLLSLITVEEIIKYQARGQLEILPLGYLRGRTFDHGMLILDEAQNTSIQDMKMFLSRLGHNSKLVINGDISQKEFPTSSISGLEFAIQALLRVENISIFYFTKKEIVRNPIIIDILEAFEYFESRKSL